jgi:excisionase family DNA binding protein
MNVEPWVTGSEVAQPLKVVKGTVYRWRQHKGLPAHRIGWLRKHKLSAVDEWVAAGGADDGSVSGDERKCSPTEKGSREPGRKAPRPEVVAGSARQDGRLANQDDQFTQRDRIAPESPRSAVRHESEQRVNGGEHCQEGGAVTRVLAVPDLARTQPYPPDASQCNAPNEPTPRRTRCPVSRSRSAHLQRLSPDVAPRVLSDNLRHVWEIRVMAGGRYPDANPMNHGFLLPWYRTSWAMASSEAREEHA